MKKKILAMLLVLVMVLGMFPMSAMAAEGSYTFDTNMAAPTSSLINVKQVSLTGAQVRKVNVSNNGFTWDVLLTSCEDSVGIALTLEATKSTYSNMAQVSLDGGKFTPGKKGAWSTTVTPDFENGDGKVSYTLTTRHVTNTKTERDFTLNFTLLPNDYVNQAPALTGESSATAKILSGETYSLNLGTAFEDPDHDDSALTYTVKVDGGEAQTAAANYSYTADADYVGEKEFVFTAKDPEGLTSEDYTVTLNIARNTAPSVAEGAATTGEGVEALPWTLNLTTLFSDVDGDDMTFTVKENGGEAKAAEANYTYTPTTQGEHILVFQATDARGAASLEHTVTLTAAANPAPLLAEGIEASETASGIIPFTYTIDLSMIFTDNEGDSLSYTVKIDDAEPIDAVVNYSYSPDVAGEHILAFYAEDRAGNTSPAYTVTMTAVANPTPTLVEGIEATATASGIIPFTYTLNLSTIFADNEGDRLAYTVKIDEADAVSAGENYNYSPETVGEHTLVFQATDSSGGKSPLYTVTVNALGNPAPTLAEGVDEGSAATAYQFFPWSTDISKFFADNEGDILTYTVKIGEADAVSANANYSYTFDTAGEQILVFQAADLDGSLSPTHTVTLNVKESFKETISTTCKGDGDTGDTYVRDINITGPKIEGYIWNVENGHAEGSEHVLHIRLAEGTEDNAPIALSYTPGYQSSGFKGSVSGPASVTLSEGKATVTVKTSGWLSSGTPRSYILHFTTEANLAPVVTDNAPGSANVTTGEAFTLDLSEIFSEPNDEPMSYTVKEGTNEAVATETVFSKIIGSSGEHTFVFTATDPWGDSASHTVTVTAMLSEDTNALTVLVPEGITPVFSVTAGYDDDGIDIPGETLAATADEAQNGLVPYAVAVPEGVETISVRAEGWGGMAFPALSESTVTLRKVQMNVLDYNNQPAENSSSVTYGVRTATFGSDGLLLVTGVEYVFSAAPRDTASFVLTNETVKLEVGTDVYVHNLMLNLNNPMTITVTTGAKAKLYRYNNYYNNTELDVKIVKDNGDGTTTYSFIADSKNGNFIYHVSMDGKIAKAGWLAWGTQNLTIIYSDSDKADDWRLDDYSATGQLNSGFTEDSVLLNVNSRNHLSLSIGQTKTLKAYRAWEIIPVSYNNYIITPDFTYTILSGSDVVSLEEKASPSTADGDWMTLTALKDGIAVIEVTYDAMNVSGGWDGDYGASDPNRTGFVVVQVGGDNDASVKFGIDGFSSIGRSGSKNISYNPNNKKDWDAEFDTLYFTENSGELNLNPTADSDILEVAVSNDKGESWTVLTDDEGVYTATIVPGNNILRVTTENGVAYQVVRGDKVTVTMSEQTGDGDGLYEAGETVRVTINGLHMPIPKMAGNYNPGYYANTDGYSSVHLNYTCNDEAVWGPGTQYSFITAANYVDIVMPDDGSSAVLTDGYIGVGVMGLTAFADGGDSHRNIPDNGCGTRESKTTYHTRSILPEIVIVNAAAEEAADKAAADAVKNLITAIGEVSLESEPAIDEARAAYNALTDAQKALVDNYSVLTEAEAALAQLKATNEDEEAADAVENLIAAIGEVSLAREEAIAEARAAYDALTDTQKALVENYESLIAAESELEALKKEAADKAAAAAVDALILAIEDVTLESENAITEAREAYDALSETQKAFVENLAVLEAAEAALEALKKDAADKAAADEVEALIAAIGEVTLEKENAISAARAEYELLTAEQKDLVENYAVLTAAEAALAQLKEESDQPETPAGTVYISVSFDGKYVNNKNGAPVAYVPVSLAALEYVDLNAYGLSKYDFDGQLTALHLYIYVHENIMGLEWRNSYVSGGAGSIFFVEGLFGFEDCNLKYYYNGAYPEIDGWGTTADQLVLADGDFFDIAAYTSWSFYGDSLTGFHFFLEDEEITHNYSAEAGEKLTVTLGRSDIEMTKVEGYTVYYGKSFGTAEGSFASGSDGKTDITFNKSGTWYLWVEGGYGASEENEDDIVSSPAYATVTVNGTDVVGDDVIVHEETTPEQPEEPTTYTVTLPNGEGYTAAATEGSTSPVNEGGSYSFTVTINEGYEAGESFAVKANGVALTAVEGVYTIANITENQNVTVEGVVEKETEGGDTPDESELSWQEVMAKTKAYLIAQATETAPVVASQYGEWAVLGLARGGVDAESEFFAKYYENVVAHVRDKIDENGRLHRSKSTDNSRVILALTALGKDVTDVGGHNLLKGLSNTAYVKNQGVNGPVWALIALDSADYEIPTDADSTEQVTREWLIAYILEKELEGGGWALSGSEPDDMTPMAVQALAPYYESDAEVKAAVDRALAVMETMSVTTETYAQIIVARSALGLDSEAALENMLTFALEDGTFRKVPNGDTNQMSTEQAFYAMVAYDRYKNDENSLYDMSDVVIEDGNGGSDEPTEPDDPDDPDDPGEGGGSGSGDEPEDEEEEKLIFGLTQEEIAGWVIVSFEDKGIRRNEELSDIEPQFRKPLGSIVPMTRVPFRIGDTVAAVTLRLLEEKGLTAYYQGDAFGGFYLEAIGDFTVKGTYYESFGEFDAGVDSGWMITWDDWFINEGASEFTVENNDLVKWQYTCQLGEDIGDPYWSEGGGGGSAEDEEDDEEVEEDEEAGAESSKTAKAEEVFADVKGHWGSEAINYVYEKGLMNGISDTEFAPDATLNRAMLVTILYRMAGEPEVAGVSEFNDVSADTWYSKAVIWAAANGIVDGVSDTEFAPTKNITREQMAVMLMRYANYMRYSMATDGDVSAYADSGSISAWAKEAVEWANAEGLINGRTEDTIVPDGTATRAEAATILMRFLESVAK